MTAATPARLRELEPVPEELEAYRVGSCEECGRAMTHHRNVTGEGRRAEEFRRYFVRGGGLGRCNGCANRRRRPVRGRRELTPAQVLAYRVLLGLLTCCGGEGRRHRLECANRRANR